MNEEKKEYKTETQRVWDRDSLHTSYDAAQDRLGELGYERESAEAPNAKVKRLSAGFAVKVWQGKTRQVKIQVES